MTNTPQPEIVPVMLADREVAAAYVAVAFGERYRDTVLNDGRWPDLVQAFARHRLASTTNAAAVVEECAKIAETYGGDYESPTAVVCRTRRNIAATLRSHVPAASNGDAVRDEVLRQAVARGLGLEPPFHDISRERQLVRVERVTKDIRAALNTTEADHG